MTKSSTVKVENIQDALALTDAFQTLTKNLDVTNEDKVTLYLHWLIGADTTTVLELEVTVRPHVSDVRGDLLVATSQFCTLTDLTRSADDMSATPFSYRFLNRDSQGTSAATATFNRQNIAIPVADGTLQFKVLTDSATSGGTLTVVAQKAHLN